LETNQSILFFLDLKKLRMENFNFQDNSDNDRSQNSRDRSQGDQSDGSGLTLTPEGARQLALENDINHLSPSCSSYYTVTQSFNDSPTSNPFNDRDEPVSSFNSLDTQFRLRWNEPVINWSNSTLSTYWLRERDEVVESSYDILQTRESDLESNANPFFPSYQLSSETQESRYNWDPHFARNETLSRSSTFVYEPDLQPANYQAYNEANDEDSIPSTQPSHIRYGAYLASLNDSSTKDHNGSND
jgi:hypothetical protein